MKDCRYKKKLLSRKEMFHREKTLHFILIAHLLGDIDLMIKSFRRMKNFKLTDKFTDKDFFKGYRHEL